MKMINYWRKFLSIGLYLVVFGTVACQGQKNEKEDAYGIVLIETSWNVKLLEAKLIDQICCINRNIVECKGNKIVVKLDSCGQY